LAPFAWTVGGVLAATAIGYLLYRFVARGSQGVTSVSTAAASSANQSQDRDGVEGGHNNGSGPDQIPDEHTAPNSDPQPEGASDTTDVADDSTGVGDGPKSSLGAADDTTPDTEDGSRASADGGTDTDAETTKADEQIAERIEAAEDALSTADDVPIGDIQEIEQQLARAHSHYIRAAARSSTADEGGVEAVRLGLVTVEAKLNALDEIKPKLTAARDAAPPDGTISNVESETVRTALSRYDELLETATDAGFDTTQVEATRDELAAALDERGQPSQASTAEEKPGPQSRPDVSSDQTGANGQDTAPAATTNGPNSGAGEAPQTSGGTSDGPEATSGSAGEATGHGSSVPQREDYVAAIERITAAHDGSFTIDRFETESEFTTDNVIDEFGSWPAAIDATDLDNSTWLLTELRTLEAVLGHEPRRTEMNLHGAVGASAYVDQFGSYDDAVDAVRETAEQETTQSVQATAEQETTQSAREPTKQETTQSAREPTKQETTQSAREPTDSASKRNYVDAIEQVARDYDGVLKTTVFNDRATVSSGEIIREFGSWTAALDAAGVDRGERLRTELRRVGEELGHPPSTTEMNRHGRVTSTMYNQYFGSFTGPRERVFADGDSDGNATTGDEVASEPAPKPTSETTANDTSAAATYSRIGTIESNSRLDAPIAVRLDSPIPRSGDRKDAAFRVTDLDGDSCPFNIWSTHEIRADWSVGHWYILAQARGKVWDSDDSTQRFLSSTTDMDVTHVGANPPDEPVHGADWADTTTESSTSTSATTTESQSEPNTSTVATADSGGQPSDEETSDDILDSLTSEFDDL
jgi:hypothetical protein